MWGAPPSVKQRARKAALINLFTGVGGFFWAGHWIYGLIYSVCLFFAFLTIFAGVGLIIFPMFWLMGVPTVYLIALQAAMTRAMWSQAERQEQQPLIDEIGGDEIGKIPA